MTASLHSPPPDPRRSAALGCEQFQIAYVTNDSDRACDLFKSELGASGFTRLEGPNAYGGYIRADFAWAGGVLYEIIHATGPGTEVFATHMPGGEEFRMVHHHFGYLVPDPCRRDAILAKAREMGWSVAGETSNALVSAFFIRVPGLDHYLEYLLPTPAGFDFFNSVCS